MQQVEVNFGIYGCDAGSNVLAGGERGAKGRAVEWGMGRKECWSYRQIALMYADRLPDELDAL